ncbi:hypothetical protein R3I93_015636 [Phoxinus phoxinus]|uniref:Matrin-3 n=1 Tax=Phoxinus phoxinus TaxID=58324 RepID=A0AAN9H0M5_9TELE
MSHKRTGANAQKGFAVGRGLLAGAETLNFSMGEAHSDPYGSSSRSRSRSRSGLVGGEGKDHDSPLHRRAGSHINTVQLFASLGLSSTDLDVLAQVPEENLCMETLPHLLMLLKSRKTEASWGDMPGGRLDCSSGQAQSRSQGDFDYTSMQETSGRGYDMLDYGSGDRQYSEFSHDSYRSLGMSASSPSDDMLMQRRMGSPSQRKVQDFLGVMPLMFPHVCSLCDFDVHSVMEWTQHTTGIRHSENRKLLLQMYPDWDPQIPSGRRSTSLSLDTKSRSDRLLGADSIGGGLQRTGMSSSWGSDSSVGMTSKITSYSTASKIKSRVVVLKYDRKPKLTNSLFDLAKPFGTIRKHLVLKNMNKAFLELQTHEEALAMANYYQRKPAMLHGKEIQVYLSKELITIKKNGRPVKDSRAREKRDVSQVVFFYHLPREGDKKMELLKIARRFGTVEKHFFVDKGAYVQMGNAEDAEMLVKYYTVNPLTINGRSIRLNICTKYKTLTVPPGKDEQGREEPARKSSGSSSAKSRTGDKPKSKNRRSSTSKAKERSDKKQEEPKPDKKEEEPKPEEVEALGDEAGDEADVMEACDEDGCDEDPSADDVDLSCDPEQTSEQAPDIDDTNLEDEEDTEAQQVKNASSDETIENQKDSGEKQEETPLEEPVTSEAEQENTDELPKDLEEQNGDQTEDEGAEEDNEEQEGQTETDFPENMDEFVTLDELVEEEDAKRKDSKSKAKYTSGSSKDRGFRVVNVVGFKRGHDYKDEILALAKPFGKVVRHLVLDVRPEAFLQFSTEKEARTMVSFYTRNALPSVCERPVRVYHSHTYPTIQSGKVIYVGNIPTFKGSDASLLKVAEPFGKIRKYYLNRLRNECYIEMERGEDAEKMAEAYKEKRPKFEGKRLVVYVSRKFKQLKRGQKPPSPETEDKRPLKRERSRENEGQRNSSGKSKDKKEDEPSVKKIKVDEPVADKAKEMESHREKESQNVSAEIVPEEKKESEEKESEDASELQNMETEPEAEDEETVASEKSVKTEEKTITTAPSEIKPETSHSTLEPYDPNVPVGVEFVKMGYYCRICFLFYSNEDTAKRIHCSSQAHYDKLKKYLEKEKAKAQSNGTKK